MEVEREVGEEVERPRRDEGKFEEAEAEGGRFGILEFFNETRGFSLCQRKTTEGGSGAEDISKKKIEKIRLKNG